MHFTTRCPACGTMFRVVPDQLKISDGWVRCGHCADVFDATLYLETWNPPVAAGGSAGAGEPVPSDAVSNGQAVPSASTPLIQKPPEAPAHVDAVPQATAAHPQVAMERSLTSTANPVPQPIPVPSDVGGAEPDGAEQAQPSLPPTAGPERETDEPSFVRQARRRAFWQSSGMRALLSVSGLLLTLALGLQIVLHERDALAAWQPRWAPTLQQLCAPLGCEVQAVRRIDAIVIDSSTLVNRLGHFYSFDLVLKNTAPVALAVPALELSLTDTRDAVIARRVFLPEELPGAPALLPANHSVAISLRLSLSVGESMPMAGYRALVFYP